MLSLLLLCTYSQPLHPTKLHGPLRSMWRFHGTLLPSIDIVFLTIYPAYFSLRKLFTLPQLITALIVLTLTSLHYALMV